MMLIQNQTETAVFPCKSEIEKIFNQILPDFFITNQNLPGTSALICPL